MSDLDTLRDLDLSGLVSLKPTSPDFLAPVTLRADARALMGQPLTAPEKFAGFHRIGFRPHGLYVPADRGLRRLLDQRCWDDIGVIPDEDARLAAYYALQAETAHWERQGLPGAWIGQQAVTRCNAQFIVTGWGRRAGKTEFAAALAVVYLLYRPGCRVWVAARTMKLVARCFDIIEGILRRLGTDLTAHRNSRDERYLELGVGSKLEGVSLDNIDERDAAAGTTVALAIVDEGAQVAYEAWTRAIYPPLTDRGGHALILSSYNGDSNWFYEQAERIKAHPENPAWAFFALESYYNFFVHPRGKKSPALLQAQLDCADPAEYLEQYCAVPRRGRNLVFPQFREKVHVDRTLAPAARAHFDRGRPVYVTGDPSGGANPYAIYAIQQYPERAYQEHVVIDEYYVPGAGGEDMTADCNQRPWRPNVVEMLIDGAYPAEVERLARLGWPVFGIEDKPKVETRLPVYRRLLRDPLRFWRVRQAHLAEVLLDQGLSLAAYEALDPADQQPLLVLLEERLADDRLTAQDVQGLRECAHLLFNQECVNAIREHHAYKYEPARQQGQSRPERARKWNDHAMDALGYYAWHYTRAAYFEGQATMALEVQRSIVTLDTTQYAVGASGPRDPRDTDLAIDRAIQTVRRAPRETPGFLTTMRARHHAPTGFRATTSLKVL